MILLKRYLPILLIPLFLPAFSFADQFKVARVVDGDTIKVSRDGTTITVRLVGIDAPETSKRKNEPGQPFSRKSTKHLASLVLKKSVTVKSYGSLVIVSNHTRAVYEDIVGVEDYFYCFFM